MKKSLLTIVLATAAISALATATIEQRTVRQRWPFSRTVDVDFVLSCDPSETYDITPRFYDGETELTVEDVAISGDFNSVSDGAHRLTIDLSRSALAGTESFTNFHVELSAVEPPLYMIVDMRKTGADANRVSYLTRTDILSGQHGTYETDMTRLGISGCMLRNPIVWTGCTNDARFASSHFLFRRIEPGAFIAAGSGASTNNVFIHHAFWLSVFEFTHGQYNTMVDGKTPGIPLTLSERRPHYNYSASSMRGSTNTVTGVNWPATGYDKVGGLIATFRSRTGIRFDLPTEAQWELAYRAGTVTKFHNGSDDNAAADLIGRHRDNGGYWDNGDGVNEPNWHPSYDQPTDPAEGYAPVGYYRPNAYGLYDMSGNIEEVCLDWRTSASSAAHLGADPSGPLQAAASSLHRVARGGSAWHSPADTGVTQRQGAGQDEASSLYGWRLAVIVEPTR